MAKKYDHAQKYHEKQAKKNMSKDDGKISIKLGDVQWGVANKPVVPPPYNSYSKSAYQAEYASALSSFLDIFAEQAYADGGGRNPLAKAPVTPPPPEFTWDDVVGQHEAKKALVDAIEGAVKNAELYKKYNKKPTRGILLYGPPGNGKTLLGKAAASQIAAIHGGKGASTAFISVKGPELLDSYLGETERKIRDLFARAKRHHTANGYPAVIFIDEAECILGHRGSHGQNTFMDSFVNQFLAEMDGIGEQNSLVILATNRPNSLDTAVIREGRIDRKIKVDRLRQQDVETILRRGLEKKPLGSDVEVLADHAASKLFDRANVLYRIGLTDGSTKTVCLGDFTSGAQIAFLVEAATQFAIDREINGGAEGILEVDFTAAIERCLAEQRELDHPNELLEFCDPFIKQIVNVDRHGDKRSVITPMPFNIKQERLAS